MTEEFEHQHARLRSEMSAYHEAVGRFVLRWAEIESLLYKVLLHYARMSEDVGRSVLSGQRARTIMESIDKTALNTDVPSHRRTDLKYQFAQLTAINTMRDYLVHHGNLNFISANFGQEVNAYHYISNDSRATVPAKAWTHQVDKTLLEKAEADLQRARLALQEHLKSDPHSSGASLIEGSGDPSKWEFRLPQPLRHGAA